jgi:hypothetical protein
VEPKKSRCLLVILIFWETGHSSARARPFVEAVEDSMMEQMVNFSTQVKGNCLDLVITNIPERVSEVFEAGRLGRSDHDMLCITLEMENRTEGPVKQTTNWKRADWPSMRADLATVDWTAEMRSKNAGEMWSFLGLKVSEMDKKACTDEKCARQRETSMAHQANHRSCAAQTAPLEKSQEGKMC